MDGKRITALCLPLLLAACQATAPRQAYYPERRLPPPTVISDSEAQQLTEHLVSARAQRATLVNNLPRVTDPGTRSEHIRSIRMLEERIRLFEHQLVSAGRPIR